MADYGDVTGVQAYVMHMAFDGPNQPTSAQVDTWLASRSAQLTGWLAGAGYATPVTLPAAKAVLDNYANLGTACLAELSQRSAGYKADDENRRENKFCAEFNAAKAWIESGALTALGVPQLPIGVNAATQPAIGTITAGTSADSVTRDFPPEWTRWPR